MVNEVSRFEFKVIGSCKCLLKILQFLSAATGFLVFLTVFGCENPKIRTQIVHLPMREEFKDTIFVKKVLWPKFSKNDKTNPIFPLKRDVDPYIIRVEIKRRKRVVESSEKDRPCLTRMMTPPLACVASGERMPDRE